MTRQASFKDSNISCTAVNERRKLQGKMPSIMQKTRVIGLQECFFGNVKGAAQTHSHAFMRPECGRFMRKDARSAHSSVISENLTKELS